MTQEAFAAVGMFATFAVSVLLLGAVAVVIISSLREWLHAKHEMAHDTENLLKTQYALMEANNRLNERVKALEAEHDAAIAAMNRAAGKWAKVDAELRELRGDAE